MPLSAPAPREELHSRNIQLRGFHRDDGLFDIEAHLVDTKSYPLDNLDHGTIPAGAPIHDMWARMTVDDTMLVVAFEAVTDHGPYTICPRAASNFAQLAGLRIGRGFIRQANARIGGTHGCTHLRELLQQMATVVFQTLYSVRRSRQEQDDDPTARPPMLETCMAFATDSPVVKRTWPAFYTGPADD